MPVLNVNLSHNSYPIHIGAGSLKTAGDILNSACFDNKAVIVSDENVWKIYEKLMSSVLNGAGIRFETVIIEPGEKSKSLKTLEYLYHRFYKFGLTRHDPVIAFGGGVTGDLAGFAASTYMRGVPFIQVPTTLLAQVDSSVGGKVAVNLEEGKNLVGSFYQPRFVIADTDLLKTLPKRELLCGMGEVIKHAFIGREAILKLLLNPQELFLKIDEIIYLNCKTKISFVEPDEHDKNIRMMLNFGHTFAHAIEKYYSFEKYSHGEAVSAGMVMAIKAGILLGKTDPSLLKALTEVLMKYEINYIPDCSIKELIPLMSGDKKNQGGNITLILLEKQGNPISFKITSSELETLFKE